MKAYIKSTFTPLEITLYELFLTGFILRYFLIVATFA